MNNVAKKRIGIISIILIHVFLFILLIGYVDIACSTKSDNLFGVPYEPSGIQMLYYYFTLPIFIVLAAINYFLNSWLKIKKWYAINSLIIWLLFCGFIEYVDDVVHFPAGNELFYQGSLIISIVSLALLISSAYWQIKNSLLSEKLWNN